LTEVEVAALLVRLAAAWPGADYDLIHHNCCDFANALCEELGVGRIPGWIDRFGRTASKVDRLGRKAAARARQTKQLARGISTDVSQALAASDFGLALLEFGKEVEEVSRWTLGPAREAVGASLRSWGRGLWDVGQRALAEDCPKHPAAAGTPTENKGKDLRQSLRIRGGAQVQHDQSEQ